MEYGTALRMTSTGDLYLSDRMRFDIITGTDKFVQDLIMLTRSIMGSYPFDLSWGIDYTSAISYTGNRSTVLSWIVQAGLKKHPLVKTVKNVTVAIDVETRQATIIADIVSKNDEDLQLEVTV